MKVIIFLAAIFALAHSQTKVLTPAKFEKGMAKGQVIPEKISRALGALKAKVEDTKTGDIGVYHYLLVYVQRACTGDKCDNVEIKKADVKQTTNPKVSGKVVVKDNTKPATITQQAFGKLAKLNEMVQNKANEAAKNVKTSSQTAFGKLSKLTEIIKAKANAASEKTKEEAKKTAEDLKKKLAAAAEKAKAALPKGGLKVTVKSNVTGADVKKVVETAKTNVANTAQDLGNKISSGFNRLFKKH